jgi:hypothetical protein
MSTCTPRGWKNAEAIAATRDFLSQPLPRRAAIRDLVHEIQSPDLFTRRCAADLARRVSASEAGILKKHVGLLMDLIAQLSDSHWQTRGYLTQAAALNLSTHAERMRLTRMLRIMAKDKRIAVRAIALEALGTVAVAEPKLREEVVPLLERASRDGICAVRLRARRVLPAVLEAAEKVRH